MLKIEFYGCEIFGYQGYKQPTLKVRQPENVENRVLWLLVFGLEVNKQLKTKSSKTINVENRVLWLCGDFGFMVPKRNKPKP